MESDSQKSEVSLSHPERLHHSNQRQMLPLREVHSSPCDDETSGEPLVSSSSSSSTLSSLSSAASMMAPEPQSSGGGGVQPQIPSLPSRPLPVDGGVSVADRVTEGEDSEVGTLGTARQHLLPPCRVCGAQATGFHYGANTCEACKGFFRRSLLRNEEYMCVQNVKCKMRPGKRNMCAACRYQRCMAAGMSKDGIKTGRYTYEKRTKDILELKYLHKEECKKKVISQKEEIKARAENLIHIIVEAQKRHHIDSTRNNSIVPLLQNKFVAQKKFEESVLGTMDPISEDQYKEVLETTGIELDDRKEVVASWISTAEKGLRQMVGFAKDLPNFKALPIEDQISLLKHSIAEAWLITRHKYINVEHGCYTAHCGYTFDLYKALDKELVDSIMAVSRRLQKLQLTFEETCLLKAMAFFFSDRCPLKQPGLVDEAQHTILEALIFLLEENHKDDNLIFARIALIMTDLRNVTEQYHKHNEKILQWTDIKSAPLIWEVMTCSTTGKGSSDVHICKDSEKTG